LSRVGIFGGTFDPIHNGHLITAQSVREIRNLDKIIFIPTFISPHKTEIKSTEPKHRLEMIKIAIDDIDFFECSEMEINKSDISYTVDTLDRLKTMYDELELIIGYDNIFAIHTWKNPDRIFDLAKVIVLRRKSSLPSVYDDEYVHKAIFVQTRGIEISATDIRERVKKGLPIHYLVPEKVEDYIYKNKLYIK
jgi:nicotinate-nucleotide adenylyltransferase